MCNGKCDHHHRNHRSDDDQPAVPTVRIRLNRQPLRIVNTEGPNPVTLKGKGHALYVVEDGFVKAAAGSVVVIKKGKVIANAHSTVTMYPGVELVRAHAKAVILICEVA